jgi:hypothetical protein
LPTLSRQGLDSISQLREIGIEPMILLPPTGNDGNGFSAEGGPSLRCRESSGDVLYSRSLAIRATRVTQAPL